jgi:hypothetical protein
MSSRRCRAAATPERARFAATSAASRSSFATRRASSAAPGSEAAKSFGENFTACTARSVPNTPGTPGASVRDLSGFRSSPRTNRYVGASGFLSKTRATPSLLVSGWPGMGSMRTSCGSNTARKR